MLSFFLLITTMYRNFTKYRQLGYIRIRDLLLQSKASQVPYNDYLPGARCGAIDVSNIASAKSSLN